MRPRLTDRNARPRVAAVVVVVATTTDRKSANRRLRSPPSYRYKNPKNATWFFVGEREGIQRRETYEQSIPSALSRKDREQKKQSSSFAELPAFDSVAENTLFQLSPLDVSSCRCRFMHGIAFRYRSRVRRIQFLNSRTPSKIRLLDGAGMQHGFAFSFSLIFLLFSVARVFSTNVARTILLFNTRTAAQRSEKKKDIGKWKQWIYLVKEAVVE